METSHQGKGQCWVKGCHCRPNDQWRHHYTHIMCYHCTQFHDLKDQLMSVLRTECSASKVKCPIFEACLHYLFPHGLMTDKEAENGAIFNEYLQVQMEYLNNNQMNLVIHGVIILVLKMGDTTKIPFWLQKEMHEQTGLIYNPCALARFSSVWIFGC